MIYDLTEDQWYNLYDLMPPPYAGNVYEDYPNWQKYLLDTFKVQYIDFDYEPTRPDDVSDHWGRVEGDEKYVNFLVLKL